MHEAQEAADGSGHVAVTLYVAYPNEPGKALREGIILPAGKSDSTDILMAIEMLRQVTDDRLNPPDVDAMEAEAKAQLAE